MKNSRVGKEMILSRMARMSWGVLLKGGGRMATVVYPIVNGPGKWDLIVALFDTDPCASEGFDINRRKLRFWVSASQNSKPRELPWAIIDGAKRESANGSLWLLDGHFIYCDTKIFFWMRYDITQRKGTIGWENTEESSFCPEKEWFPSPSEVVTEPRAPSATGLDFLG